MRSCFRPICSEGRSPEELLHALLGAGSGLDDLKRLLVQRTEGNPLFLEEIVRTLAETTALAGAPGAYQVAQPISAIRIAPSLHALPVAENALHAQDLVLEIHIAGPERKPLPGPQPRHRVRDEQDALRPPLRLQGLGED